MAFALCGFGVMLFAVAGSGRVAAAGMVLFFAGTVLGTWVSATQ